MQHKKLTLSIVIPVFNEERYLKDCLDSIAAQRTAPDEVIVVDNNSTDRSMAIAQSYNFVTIVSEPKQSQVYAQKTGFDAATGDIIGRIDADSILPEHWIEYLLSEFTSKPSVAAITGRADPYDVPLRQTATLIMRTYHRAAGLVAGHRMLWGANFAFRRKLWPKISGSLIQRSDVWEDYDISFKIARYGKIVESAEMTAGVSFRAIHKPFRTQLEYQTRAIRTFSLNTSKTKTATFAVLWSTVISIYPLTAFSRLCFSLSAYSINTLSKRLKPQFEAGDN